MKLDTDSSFDVVTHRVAGGGLVRDHHNSLLRDSSTLVETGSSYEAEL